MTQNRQESARQGLSIKLNEDKTKCRNIHIGFDLAVFLCLQKYANVLHDMLRLMEFLEPMVQVKLNYCVCVCSWTCRYKTFCLINIIKLHSKMNNSEKSAFFLQNCVFFSSKVWFFSCFFSSNPMGGLLYCTHFYICSAPANTKRIRSRWHIFRDLWLTKRTSLCYLNSNN